MYTCRDVAHHIAAIEWCFRRSLACLCWHGARRPFPLCCEHNATCLCRHAPPFIDALADSDVAVRREAVQFVASAVTAAPALLDAALPGALPPLLRLTAVDESLIKTIDLGPFKQKQDQGLPVRKLAFDTLEVRCAPTLIVMCLRAAA